MDPWVRSYVLPTKHHVACFPLIQRDPRAAGFGHQAGAWPDPGIGSEAPTNPRSRHHGHVRHGSLASHLSTGIALRGPMSAPGQERTSIARVFLIAEHRRESLSSIRPAGYATRDSQARPLPRYCKMITGHPPWSTPAIRHSRLSAWIWIDETPETKEWLDQASSSSAIEPLKSHPRPVH